MKKMRSLMQSVQKSSSSNSTTKKENKKKSTHEKKKKDKKKKDETSSILPPPPPPVQSTMGPPAASPTGDMCGLSTKNGGKRTKKSTPTPSRTVMMGVQESSKASTPSSDNSDFQPANSSFSPVSTVGTPAAESPLQTEVKEVDIPVEPVDQIIDPEKETRAIVGRDPDNMTADQMNNLRAFISQYDQVGVRGLLEEFNGVKNYNLVPFDITSHEKNPTKNRYQDIFCLEPTRIQLHDGLEGDYIHANYVNKVPLMNQFITTQGPLEPTVNDFWRLVVQENVGYIFMLCSIIELGKKKCEQYYPEAVGETRSYGDIKVTLEWKREDDSHFINCKMLLEAPGKPKRYVYHHYWKNWPDRGVPITALAGLRLLHSARQTTTSSIVHCSAGVGRTGTLVAIEWLLQQIISTSPPYNMVEMLRAVRNQRAHAIQTAPQYAYVCFVVFRLYTMLEPNNNEAKALFLRFSADMQQYAGVVLPPPAGAPSGSDPNAPRVW